MTVKFNALQLRTLLLAAAAAKPFPRRVLVKGSPGIGKTHIITQIAEFLKAFLVMMHPSVGDPTDYKGMPWIANGEATFLPFGELRYLNEAISKKRFTICFIDDLGQGTTAVQAAIMQMLDRYRDSPYIMFVAATNLRTDRAGVTGLLEPVKSRFDTIVELMVEAKAWALWAESHDIDYRLIAYLRNVQPDALHKFEATSDLVNQPSPRTWGAVDGWLKAGIDDQDVLFGAMVGAVGEAHATGFNAFLKTAADAPDYEDIKADPHNAKLATEPSAQYATVAAIQYHFEVKDFAAVAIYAERMFKAEQGEFCALLMAGLWKKHPEIEKTPAFTKMSKSPLAHLVMEAVRSLRPATK